MTRLTVQESSVTELAHEFAVARCNFPAHGDDAGATFDFPAFKRAVVHVHVLRLGGDSASIVWIEDDEVRIGARLDCAFARKEVERFGYLGAGGVDEGVQIKFS